MAKDKLNYPNIRFLAVQPNVWTIEIVPQQNQNSTFLLKAKNKTKARARLLQETAKKKVLTSYWFVEQGTSEDSKWYKIDPG